MRVLDALTRALQLNSFKRMLYQALAAPTVRWATPCLLLPKQPQKPSDVLFGNLLKGHLVQQLTELRLTQPLLMYSGSNSGHA